MFGWVPKIRGLFIIVPHRVLFLHIAQQNSPLESNRIDLLRTSNEGKILVGGNSLYIHESRDKPWKKVPFDGSHVDKIFEDYKGLLWVTSGKYGVLQIDQSTGKSSISI
jgi:ligand-binding sensor domain-containing protein